ncbi:MAG: TlpA family protein disulfide reductase [Bacillota bacterium]|nr:MAG: TlpA family protein disulfide reductase [Bacillota bacterium]
MLQLQRTARELEERGFRLFVVTLGRPGDTEFLEGNDIANVVLDPNAAAFEAYDISAIPETFFIDGDGVIRKDVVGWRGDESLRDFARTAEELLGP